jgi:hypothetical protein
VKEFSRGRMRASGLEIVGLLLLLVEGMNHVLKLTPADPKKQLASYGYPSLRLAPKLPAEFVAFVKGVKRK